LEKVPVIYDLGGQFERYNGKALCQLMFSSGGYACVAWLARLGPDYLRYRAAELIELGESGTLDTVVKCNCRNPIEYLVRHQIKSSDLSARYYYYNEWFCTDCVRPLTSDEKIMPFRFSLLCNGNAREQSHYKKVLRALCCYIDDPNDTLKFFFENKVVSASSPWNCATSRDIYD
jgi:hypothetical protein